VYVRRATPASPSPDVTVTVYVCLPVVEVFRWPGEPESFESWHELSPGPPAPSEHENAVGTTWPCSKVRLLAGEEIEAVGAGVYVMAISGA
jgi:hypothetical protein